MPTVVNDLRAAVAAMKAAEQPDQTTKNDAAPGQGDTVGSSHTTAGQSTPNSDDRSRAAYLIRDKKWTQVFVPALRHHGLKVGNSKGDSVLFDGDTVVARLADNSAGAYRVTRHITLNGPDGTPGNTYQPGDRIDAIDVTAEWHGSSHAEMIRAALGHEEQVDENTFADDVAKGVRDLRVRAEAKRRFDAGEQGDVLDALGKLDVFTGDTLRQVEPPDARYRIDRLWNTGGQVLVFAQAKRSKSTLSHDAARCIATGAPFLGVYTTTPVEPGNKVGVIDMELNGSIVAAELRDMHGFDGDTADRVVLYALRAQTSLFDIMDDTIFGWWADRLRRDHVETLIVDGLYKIVNAAHLDEDKDAGRVMERIAELCLTAGVVDHMIIDHASTKVKGRPDTARGDSKKMDTADNLWRWWRPDDDDEDRYTLESTGRIQSETVQVARHGYRFASILFDDDGEPLKVEDVFKVLRTLLDDPGAPSDGMSKEQLTTKAAAYIEEHGGHIGRKPLREMIEELVDLGALKKSTKTGRGGGYMFTLTGRVPVRRLTGMTVDGETTG